jgi:trigger factor
MEQKKFIGSTVGHTVVFNPYKAYKGAEAELASFLRIEKEKVKEMKSDFTFEIKEITRNMPAEMDQKLFDLIFGEGEVKDEADFREKTKDQLDLQFYPESEYKFVLDARALLLAKVDGLLFADDILKRWLLLTNKDLTKEEVEKDYHQGVSDLKYRLIKEKLIKDYDLKVQKEDIDNYSRRVIRERFAQQGMYSVPDNVVDKYAEEMIKKKETVSEIIERVLEEKLMQLVKEKVTVTTQEITYEEFNELKIKN